MFRARATPEKALRKGARVRALAERSCEQKADKKNVSNDMTGVTDFLGMSSAERNELLCMGEQHCKENTDLSAKNPKVTMPRLIKLRKGKVYRMDFLLKCQRKIDLTMVEDIPSPAAPSVTEYAQMQSVFENALRRIQC